MIFNSILDARETGLARSPRYFSDNSLSNPAPFPSPAAELSTPDTNPLAPGATANARVLRPCGITAGTVTRSGFIRHMSANGAQIETDAALAVGDEVEYFWDSLPSLRARVAWACDGLVGLRNLPQTAADVATLVPRGMRVACRLSVRIDRGRESFKGFVGNISRRGLLVYGAPAMEPGSRLDLTVGDTFFADAEVRWSRAGCIGVALGGELALEAIATLMERADDGDTIAAAPGRVAYGDGYESRSGFAHAASAPRSAIGFDR